MFFWFTHLTILIVFLAFVLRMNLWWIAMPLNVSKVKMV
uniref:Uncharacterized protein n=1 Tax=Rhizophora mucronata TaxID=61149 RepID=A0A2P2PAK9_RHIMU